MRFQKYMSRIGIALSVLLNVILGGKSNQTFSARNWELKENGKPNLVLIIDRIFWLDPDHCKSSWVFWDVIHHHYIDKNQFE